MTINKDVITSTQDFSYVHIHTLITLQYRVIAGTHLVIMVMVYSQTIG